MKREVNPAIIVVALVVLVGGIVGAFVHYGSPHPPAGVKYTPGVPPWMEKGGGEYKRTPDYPSAPAPAASQSNPGSPIPPFSPPAIGTK